MLLTFENASRCTFKEFFSKLVADKEKGCTNKWNGKTVFHSSPKGQKSK
jgi:hypothetical protein